LFSALSLAERPTIECADRKPPLPEKELCAGGALEDIKKNWPNNTPVKTNRERVSGDVIAAPLLNTS